MEHVNHLKNVEMYVQKEQRNEQEYKNRFEVANKRMFGNANHLVSSVERDPVTIQKNVGKQKLMDGVDLRRGMPH